MLRFDLIHFFRIGMTFEGGLKMEVTFISFMSVLLKGLEVCVGGSPGS